MTRQRRSPNSWPCALATLLIAFVAGCMDATDVEVLTVEAAGTILGRAYLDLNRNGSFEAGDPPLQDMSVILSPTSNNSTVALATTDTAGNFILSDVPTGRYRVRLSQAALGDTLGTLVSDPMLDVRLGDTISTSLGASYPQLTVEQLRSTPAGRRVFTTGIALNLRDNPADGRVFLKGALSFVQVLDVPRVPNIAVGDSVRILGRTITREGQPMLQADTVPPVILVPRATVPTAHGTTTGVAATAGGGALDAALVRIQQAEISDTSTVGGDFLFTADDGSGPIQVVLRPFLARGTSDLRPDTVLRVAQATGMLSPYDDGSGSVRWRLLVRSAVELATELRLADVRATATFEPTTSSQGSSVQLMLVVSNAGPLAATGVEVTDTLPAALTRGEFSVTAGSYASTSVQGRWTLDRIEPGAADTLRATIDVTGSQLGTATYIARVGGLDREVDNVPDNNRATATLTLTAPD